MKLQATALLGFLLYSYSGFADSVCPTDYARDINTGERIRVSICEEQKETEGSKETTAEWSNRVANEPTTRIREHIQPGYLETEVLPGIFLMKTGITWGGWGTSLDGVYLRNDLIVVEVAHSRNEEVNPVLKEIFNGSSPEQTQIGVRLVDFTTQRYEVSIRNNQMQRPQIFQVRLR